MVLDGKGILFGRDLVLQVGGAVIPMHSALDLPGLRINFIVNKTSAKEPNAAEVTLYNLSETNRKILQEGSSLIPLSPKGIVQTGKYVWPLIIEAGYKKKREQIFAGDIFYITISRTGPDWICKIQARDGGTQYKSKRMNVTFAKGTPVSAVLGAAAHALGVGLGNSTFKFQLSPAFRKGFTLFKSSVTVSGLVSDILNKYVKSIGYRWSIQDGQLQVLGLQETLLDTQIMLTPETGLLGSPEIGEKRVLSGSSLLQGGIKPGRQLWVKSSMINGRFRVENVAHTGDTYGNEWYSNFEAKEIV